MFVYTSLIDVGIECVYDVLEFVLEGFPFSGVIGGFCTTIASGCDSRLVTS